MVKNPWTTMRSIITQDGCHKDMSQDKNESITHKKKTSTAQENHYFSFTFCFFQPKKYPAPIEYVALLSLMCSVLLSRNPNITT
jgi:hypothetical protein